MSNQPCDERFANRSLRWPDSRRTTVDGGSKPADPAGAANPIEVRDLVSRTTGFDGARGRLGIHLAFPRPARGTVLTPSLTIRMRSARREADARKEVDLGPRYARPRNGDLRPFLRPSRGVRPALNATWEGPPHISGSSMLVEGSSVSRLEVLVLWRVIDPGRIWNEAEMVSHWPRVSLDRF
jgi:hypothetical protein